MSASIKIVSVTKVMSRNLMVDFWQNIKSMFGGRLLGYEKAIDVATNQAIDELYKKYPMVKYVRIEFCIVAPGAYGIIAYGEDIVNNESNN